MEVQEAFGLKRRHTYDEVVAWLNSDPKGVTYPSRVAYKTYNSPIYGQLKDSLRTFNAEATQGYLAHQRGEDEGALATLNTKRGKSSTRSFFHVKSYLSHKKIWILLSLELTIPLLSN